MNHVASKTSTKAPTKHTFYGWLVCFIGALFYLYEYLLRVTPSQMTKELQLAFHINAQTLGHLVGYYYYIYAPMQLFVGILMDRYGPRRLLTMAVFCCALGTYLFANNQSLYVAELGRFLVGFGSAFAFVGVLKLATLFLPSRVFGMVSGMSMALGMAGGMLGDMLISAMVNHYDWRLTLYYSAAVGVLLNVIIYCVVRDAASPKLKYKPSIKTLRGGLNGLIALLLKPAIWINGAVGCLLYLPTSTFAEFWGTPYLEQVCGMSKHQAALGMTYIFLGWAVGGPLVGFISDRIKQRRLPLTIGSSVAAVVFSAVLFLPNFPVKFIYPAFFIFGFFSSVQVLVFALGRELAQAKYSATVLALTNMFVMSGGTMTLGFVGKILDRYWTGEIINGVHVYSASNFQYALAILPLGLLISVLLTLFLPETNARMLEDMPSTEPSRETSSSAG